MKRAAPVDAFRDCSSLWAPAATVQCALKYCIPCAYKLVVVPPSELDGERLRPPSHANVRPELCPRQIAAVAPAKNQPEETKKLGKRKRDDNDNGSSSDDNNANDTVQTRFTCKNLYDVSQTFLVVGDGDFTFSLALARNLGLKANIVCTSYQSEAEVKSTYREAENTLDALAEFPTVSVRHGVDATQLAATLSVNKGRYFTRILFNFPCVPDNIGQDGQAEQLEANKALIRGFLSSAAPLLSKKGGQIHIAHKTKEPFSWWKIPKLCSEDSGCRFVRDVAFDKSLFPGYIPRKVGENKSFPITDAVVHCFTIDSAGNAKDADDEQTMATADAKADDAEPACDTRGLFTADLTDKYRLVKVTNQRLLQVVSLLQILSDRPKLAAHNQRAKRDRGTLFGGPIKKRDTKKVKARTKARKQAARKKK